MKGRALCCPNCSKKMSIARFEHRDNVPLILVYDCEPCGVYVSVPMDEGAENRTL